MAYRRGHVTRTPRTSRTAQAWYDRIAEAHIARIEIEQTTKETSRELQAGRPAQKEARMAGTGKRASGHYITIHLASNEECVALCGYAVAHQAALMSRHNALSPAGVCRRCWAQHQRDKRTT